MYINNMGHRVGINGDEGLLFFPANFQFYEIPQDVYNQKYINWKE